MKQVSRSFCAVVVSSALLLSVFVACNRQERPVDYVDPFICTQGDHGQWLPAALVPFGLAELCPDTWPGSLTADGDFAHGGYDYSDNHVRGFSHFHKGSSGGTTVGDRAGYLSILPYTAMPSDTFFLNPIVEIDKSTEQAEAGYYTVTLKDDDIKVSLTATTRTGFQKIEYNTPTDNKLFIYEGRRDGSGLVCNFTSDRSIEGSCGDKYFVMQFNKPVDKTEIFDGEELKDGNSLSGQRYSGLVCSFSNLDDKTLIVKTGLSLSSIDNARQNLEAESPDWNFEETRVAASEAWNDVLSNIEVFGNNVEDKTIFYTALYHTCFLPVIHSDVDGTYRGVDKEIRKVEGHTHYDGYAFWDSFRSKYPLYSLFIPDVYSDIVTSLRYVYENTLDWGTLPYYDHPPHGDLSTFKAIGENGYSTFASCRSEHMLMVVVDAYVKGLVKTDIKSMYPYMMKEVMLQMPPKYDTIGYITARPDQTGEYCWDNWALAQVAKDLDYNDDYEYLMKRSEYWRNTWDPDLMFFRARAADGTWLDFPEDPTENREKYTYEGTKWHWRWNVLHDVPSLIECFHGKENFTKQLEYFFDNDLYTAGNQIDIQAPFMFDLSDAPWLTQKWVRKILKEPIKQLYGTHDLFAEPIYDKVYKSTPDGYLEEMDDDYGCMSSWYVMAAMGIYQMCPGNPVYQITAPIFDEVKINLDNEFYKGKNFIIKAEDLSDENIYIQSATLDGKPLDKSHITHDDIVNGGTLVFKMGNTPNKNWGI